MARSILSREALAQLPRVTLGVLLASLLLQLCVSLGFREQLRAADSELRSAVALFVEHPMLAIPARFAPVLSDRMPGYDGNAAFDFLKARNQPTHQAELDAAVQRALAQLDSHPQRALGRVPARPRAASWLLHPLVHGGWLHWLAAALPFALVAAQAERLWGWRVLAAFLPLASVFGALAFGALTPELDRPLLGLGSWTAALVAALALRARDRRVDPLEWLRPLVAFEWRAPAWALVPVFAAGELLAFLGLGSELPPSLRAHPAPGTHLLCATLGALCAFALERSGAEQRLGVCAPPSTGSSAPARPARTSRETLERARAASRAGRLDLAAELLAAEARGNPGHRELVGELWQVACQLGQPTLAFPAMQALVASELRRGAVDAAVAHWKRIAQVERRPVFEVETLFQLAPLIRERGGAPDLRGVLEQLLRHPAVRGDAALLLRVVELAGPESDKLLAEAVELLRELPGLSAEQREKTRELAARQGLPESGEEAGAARLAPTGSDAFFAEQDRSAFGSLAETTELTDVGALERDASLDEVALFPGLFLRSGLPLALRDDGIVLEIEGRGRRRLPYRRLRRIGFAGVRGLAPRPILVVDLLLSDPRPGASPLEVVRLRSDGFNPQRLVPEAPGALEALQAFVAELARRARVEVVPLAIGGRLETYDSLEDYERRVLRAKSGGAPPRR